MLLLNELAAEVAAELSDERFAGKRHYDRNRYAEGCHGPLCKKAERDRANAKYAANNPNRKRRPRKADAIVRDAYLDQVIALLRRNDVEAAV